MKHHPLCRWATLLAIILLAGNCRKTEISLESEAISYIISGRVLDKDNTPVSQAEVKAGAASTTTDVDGYFRLSNVKSPKDAAYVTVYKSGYFPGSRTFLANAGTVNFVNIRLIPKEITGSFTASGGGVINLSPGGSISFQANSIVDAVTNGAYSGTVSVSSFFIDPTAAGFNSLMPGDLRGITTSNQERGLQSFGMMAVELTGQGGQKLQLASGKGATVKFPIPAGLLSKAPASIPLWYFDETTGMWKEEGKADKQGNFYVGIVGHFSFWNCDAPFSVIQFEAVVKDQQGNPVRNAWVRIMRVNDGGEGSGCTDSTGRVRGLIPANEPLEMKIYDRCGQVIHSQNIGPFSSNVNLGTITVNYQPPGSVTIAGTVVNCSNAAVTNGFVNVNLDGMNHRTNINNGNFSITMMRCNVTPTQAQVVAVDVAGNQQSALVPVTVTTGNANAGQISACGVATTEFINYSIASNNYSIVPPDSLLAFHHNTSTPVTNYVMGMELANYNEVSIVFEGVPGLGNRPLVRLEIRHGNTKYLAGSGLNVTVTEFGAPGQFMAGNVAGTLSDGTVTHPFTCSFRVRRVQ
ncbi:MAG TPA: carboxypeptidase-like regulatory domain-containing protein [Chitinophagaceae bacterium]|nr:carboxypeptidase-like regulatory domain-containing protein [Chitinophagaceae bacterium]